MRHSAVILTRLARRPIDPVPTLDLSLRSGRPGLFVAVQGEAHAYSPGPRPVVARPASLDLRPPIDGELLCDGAGRLYEKVGRWVRPLHQLTASPSSRMLDVFPPRSASTRRRPPVDAGAAESAEQRGPSGGPAGGATQRVVRLGDFPDILASQLARPEQLRAQHRLLCRIAVHEVTSETKARLSLALRSDLPASARLHLLTEDVRTRLGLPGPPVAPAADRAPGQLLPGDRLFRMQVLQDPTRDSTAGPSAAAKPPQAAPPRSRPAARVDAPQRGIPTRYLKPWEFRYSREEALADMESEEEVSRGSLLSWISAWLSALVELPTRRSARRRWHARLVGKSLEQQLWDVRPPEGALGDRDVREWASLTLTRAGYDSRVMQAEWEIFWRRKGC